MVSKEKSLRDGTRKKKSMIEYNPRENQVGISIGERKE